ncbi:hypothetical protein B484DRAFT_412622 [Ochromonadaceae sp. CCMP2298]|nr:hypothetical protein B484DRAFT_412622 [Ochromonadaceae sp. CCMP2298]
MPMAALLLIDVQNDFHAGGSLAVPGADEDAARIAQMIMDNLDSVSEVFVTLDSHNREHIAHTNRWNSKADGTGEAPGVFTLISHQDVVDGVWHPTDPTQAAHCASYTKALEEKGRFKLTIWPDHCIIGSPGNDVVPSIQVALDAWQTKTGKKVQYVRKGQNNLTEMYSAIEAEVPMDDDHTTGTNHAFVEALKGAERVIIGGQALSHCVNYTTRDLVKYWTREPQHLVLLTDGASAVPGCDADAAKFVEDMRAANLTLASCAEAFSVL